MTGDAMKFVELDGAVLRYRVAGDPRGPAVVFANSLGTDLTIWDEVVARLPQGYRMVGMDKRGHGLTSLPGGSVTIADHAGDVLRLMDHLGIDEAVIAGVSVGGLIAQKVAALSPARVRGVVLCNTGAKIGSDQIWNPRIEMATTQGLEPMADAVMERWFTPPFHADRATELAGYRAMLTNTPALGYAATCRAIRDEDLTESTRALSVPALCIAGSGDLATPPELVQTLAGLIDGAEYLEIAECGHIPMVEQPDQCADAIAGFLAGFEDGAALSRGTATRRKVLGGAHVDRSVANATAMDTAYVQFITEGPWGSVWSRKYLPLRLRSMLTVSLLAAIGQEEELKLHLRATANTGATEDDIAEAMLHVAVYAGVPRANHALKIAKEVFAELREES
ncbi:MAG: 3-oxoadipate enol-lactonase [Pseudomonadota bacterium]